jgi:hypothetical protein
VVAAALRPPAGALAAVLRLATDFFAPDFGDFASDLDDFFMATLAAGRGKARENFG